MDLVLTTSQKLALSQRMLQSGEILQMSSQELLEYVKEFSIENPVVEYEETTQEENKFDLMKKKIEWLDANDEQNKSYYKEEKNDDSNYDMWNFKGTIEESLEEYLYSQISVLPIDNRMLNVSHYIIDSINPNGYFEDTIENISTRLKICIDFVGESLNLIQSLEPAGVGARNLKECLQIQLKRLNVKNILAEKIVDKELETLAKNQIPLIAKKLKVSVEDVIIASNLIKSLNPKPGNSFSSKKNLEYITPDALIVKNNHTFEIVINDYYFPKIYISSYYKDIICDEGSENAKDYVCDKIKQAEWVMKCISKRNSTLLKTIQAILELQINFFENGIGNLKPMRLIDIAEKIEMHESTVSRAIRDKYLQCDWGVFPLNYFFNNAMSALNEEDTTTEITPDSIKIKIKEIIQEEDNKKPKSDREITETLTEMGISISRRTVAKYRESMGIPGTVGRKCY